MGRNRKWVLENDLSEAVWRTILRGPRPPSVVWPRGSERSSSVSTKGPGGLNQGRSPHHQSVKSRASKGLAKPAALPSVRLSPDERVAEARARVARLEAALQVLGETTTVPRPACWREVGFHPEVHPKIAGQDGEDPSQTSPANSLFGSRLWRVWKGCASEGCVVVRRPSLKLHPLCQLQRKTSKPVEAQKLVVHQLSWT